MTITAAQDLTAIGPLAGQHGVTVRCIEGIVTTLKLRGVWRLNGVVYFDANAVETIVAHLADKRTRTTGSTPRRFSAKGAR